MDSGKVYVENKASVLVPVSETLSDDVMLFRVVVVNVC